MFMWDEAHYAVLGRALARGEGYVKPDGNPESLRPPVLPAAVATTLIVAPAATDVTIRRVTVVVALLCIAVIYGCVCLEAGVFAATAAALLFATFPEIWRSTSYLLTELPFMLFYTPAVFFFHRGMHVDSRNFVIAWPCFALALLTRYTAVLFGPTCLLLVAFPILTKNRAALERMRSPAFLLGPAIAAVMLTPLFGRAWIHFGDPLVGFKAAANQLPAYSVHAHMPLLYYLTLLPTMLGWLPTVALVVAVGEVLGRRDKLAICCLIAAAVIVAWLSRYGWKEPRLISAALPFLAIVIALFLDSVSVEISRVVGERTGRNAPAVLAASVVILCAAAFRFDPSYARASREILHSQTLGYPSFRTAMEAIANQTPNATVLMGPNCYQISWYSDRSCRPLPSLDSLASQNRSLSDVLADVDYVIATSFERGQPTYIEAEVRRAERTDGDRVQTFRDRRYWTKVIPAEVLIRSDTSGAATSDDVERRESL